MIAHAIALLVLTADPSTDSEAFQRWLKFYTEAAGQYRIEVQGSDTHYKPLTLRTTPVLQYTNPERGFGQHGAIYVWTSQGRPLCIGSIWSNTPADDPQHRWVAHELHSLHAGPLRSHHEPRQGKRGPVPQWVTEQPGIQWNQIEGGPPPADKPALRLVQMRRLAEKFTAKISGLTSEADRELRLLTKPLYRYPTDVSGAKDGALFAFVQGTDPEVLLLIEANEQGGWSYGFARFTHAVATVQRNGQTVWDCPKAEMYAGSNPYFLFPKIHTVGLQAP
jgi:hypothetical protein